MAKVRQVSAPNPNGDGKDVAKDDIRHENHEVNEAPSPVPSSPRSGDANPRPKRKATDLEREMGGPDPKRVRSTSEEYHTPPGDDEDEDFDSSTGSHEGGLPGMFF